MLISVSENLETDYAVMVRLIPIMKVAGKVWSGRGFCLRGVFPAFSAVVSTSGKTIFLSSFSDNKNYRKRRLGF